MRNLVILSACLLCYHSPVSGKLTENRSQSRELQRALGHDNVVLVINGIMERIIGQPSPDPLVLINFPDINTQFKVHVLEDSRKIKITLARDDGKNFITMFVKTLGWNLPKLEFIDLLTDTEIETDGRVSMLVSTRGPDTKISTKTITDLSTQKYQLGLKQVPMFFKTSAIFVLNMHQRDN